MLLVFEIDRIELGCFAKTPFLRWIVFVLDIAGVSKLMVLMAESNYSVMVLRGSISIWMVVTGVWLVATWERALAVVVGFSLLLG